MATHLELWKVCRDTEEYESGKFAGERPDCSVGCKHFHSLEGKEGFDWGVCTNPKSTRAGLLTFEHMSCDEYEKTTRHVEE